MLDYTSEENKLVETSIAFDWVVVVPFRPLSQSEVKINVTSQSEARMADTSQSEVKITGTSQSDARITDLSADAPARREAGAVWDQVLGVEGLHREVTQP